MTFNFKYALYSYLGVPSGNVVKVMLTLEQDMKTMKCDHKVKCASHIAYICIIAKPFLQQQKKTYEKDKFCKKVLLVWRSLNVTVNLKVANNKVYNCHKNHYFIAWMFLFQ